MAIDLEKRVTVLETTFLESSDEVRLGEKQIADFKDNDRALLTELQQFDQQIADAERKVADTVLAGGAVNLQPISDLKRKKVDAEGKRRIYADVLTMATTRQAQTVERVKNQLSLDCFRAAGAALQDLNVALAAARLKLPLVQRASQLPYLNIGTQRFRLKDMIIELEALIDRFAAEAENSNATVAELETLQHGE